MRTVTDSDLTTLGGAVASPYGPLTLVGTVDDAPTPNYDIKFLFTSNIAATPVYLSAQQLETPALLLELLENAHAPGALVQAIITSVAGLYAITNAMSAPHSQADLTAIKSYIVDNMYFLRGIVGSTQPTPTV